MDKSKKLYKQTLQAGLIACTILAIGLITSFWTYRHSLKNAVANDVSQALIQEFFNNIGNILKEHYIVNGNIRYSIFYIKNLLLFIISSNFEK